MLEHGITKERLPFVYGWHRLIVAAQTKDLCVRRVEAVVEHYRDIGIDVVNSTGDQFSLFCESLPGDRLRLNAYAQRQVSTIYTQRNQYRLILEIDPRYQEYADSLRRLNFRTARGAMVALESVLTAAGAGGWSVDGRARSHHTA